MCVSELHCIIVSMLLIGMGGSCSLMQLCVYRTTLTAEYEPGGASDYVIFMSVWAVL